MASRVVYQKIIEAQSVIRKERNDLVELTAKKTESIASRMEVTTFCFFSLNFSRIVGIQANAYGVNFFLSPLASPARHFPATAMTMTFESLPII